MANVIHREGGIICLDFYYLVMVREVATLGRVSFVGPVRARSGPEHRGTVDV